jgi:hypothetical protein
MRACDTGIFYDLSPSIQELFDTSSLRVAWGLRRVVTTLAVRSPVSRRLRRSMVARSGNYRGSFSTSFTEPIVILVS